MQKFVENLERTLGEALDVDYLFKVVAALEAKDAKGARASIEADITAAKNYLLSHATFLVR
jgi:DNA-binding GntR family transcriptional regulator